MCRNFRSLVVTLGNKKVDLYAQWSCKNQTASSSEIYIIYNQCEAVGKRAEAASKRSKHLSYQCYMVMKSRCFTYSIEVIGFLSRILRK